MISTILLSVAGLAWLFVGLVSTQLIWRTLPNEKGDFRYEWSLFLIPFQLLLTVLGPVTAFLYVSHVTTNRIFASKGNAAIRADRERLLNAIYEKVLAEDMDIADIGNLNVDDLQLDSGLPTLLGGGDYGD